MGAVLIQFGAWHLHGFPEQRFELVQNGNGLTVDAVQMERGHANGWLIFKWAKEHGEPRNRSISSAIASVSSGSKSSKRATNIGPVERNIRPLPREHSTRQAAHSAKTRSPASKPKQGIDLSDIVDFDGDQPALRATRRISPMALTRA